MKRVVFHSWVAFVLCISLGWHASAQEGFDPPSLGDIVGGELSAAFDAAQQAAESKAQFNAEIEDARARYIEALKAGERSGPTFEAVQSNFARLLAAKDVYYFTMFVAEGITNTTIERARATDALTGGALDNAIPEHAWDAFSDWVFEVRFRLGAGMDGQVVFVTDPDRILAAILDSTDAYRSYTTKRDEAEFIAAGLIAPKDVPSARPGKVPQELVARLEPLYEASLEKLQPGFREHDFAGCLLYPIVEFGCESGMRDDNGNLRDSNRNRMQLATAYYHLPGVYRLEMMRSTYMSDDFEHVTGRCVIFDNPVGGAPGVVLVDGSPIDEFVHTQKRMICEIGDKIYANSAAQTSLQILFPHGSGRFFIFDHDSYLSRPPRNIELTSRGYQGPTGFFMVPLSLESDTLVGYQVKNGPAGYNDKRQVIATKLVREGDLVDLATLDLAGTYEVTLGYGAGLAEQAEQDLEFGTKHGERISDRRARAPDYFASASYRLTCVLRYVGAFEALEMVCRDPDGVLITPGRNPITWGVCSKPQGVEQDGQLSECRLHGPDDGDWVPFSNVGWGRRSTEGNFEVFKPEIIVKNGILKEEANYFSGLNSPLIIADPGAPQVPGEARLIIQWGELFGPMVRIGDPVILNEADRDWLAFYGPVDGIAMDDAIATDDGGPSLPNNLLNRAEFRNARLDEPLTQGIAGTAQQGSMSYEVRIHAAAGGIKVDYPGLCSGDLTYLEQDGSGLLFRETIRTGQGSCSSGGFVTLTARDDGRVDYVWNQRRGAGMRAAGMLAVDGATGQSGSDAAPPTENDDRSASLSPPTTAAAPVVSLAKNTFRPGETVEVTVSGLPGNQADWITLVPEDHPPNKWGEFKYTQGVTEGTWSFWAPNTPGLYEVRVYFNNGYEIKARTEIEVLPRE